MNQDSQVSCHPQVSEYRVADLLICGCLTVNQEVLEVKVKIFVLGERTTLF